jgi:hypothetical protein
MATPDDDMDVVDLGLHIFHHGSLAQELELVALYTVDSLASERCCGESSDAREDSRWSAECPSLHQRPQVAFYLIWAARRTRVLLQDPVVVWADQSSRKD